MSRRILCHVMTVYLSGQWHWRTGALVCSYCGLASSRLKGLCQNGSSQSSTSSHINKLQQIGSTRHPCAPCAVASGHAAARARRLPKSLRRGSSHSVLALPTGKNLCWRLASLIMADADGWTKSAYLPAASPSCFACRSGSARALRYSTMLTCARSLSNRRAWVRLWGNDGRAVSWVGVADREVS